MKLSSSWLARQRCTSLQSHFATDRAERLVVVTNLGIDVYTTPRCGPITSARAVSVAQIQARERPNRWLDLGQRAFRGVSNALFGPVPAPRSDSAIDGRKIETSPEIASLDWDRPLTRVPPFAVHPDDRRILIASGEGTVEMLDLDSLRVLESWKWGLQQISCLAISANGLMAAAAGTKGAIVLWDLE